MLFKHLITHYLWSRSFSHKELSNLLGVKERDVMNWEDGIVPDPKLAFQIQQKLSYPKIKFWDIYFRSISIDLGEDLSFDLLNYEEFNEYLNVSKNYRKNLKHKAIPSDECSYLFDSSYYNQNPQDLNTVLSIKLKYSYNKKTKKSFYKQKDVKKLADSFELSIDSMNKLLNSTPTREELTKLIQRSPPGYERDSILLGYFSLLIKEFDLGLFLDRSLDKSTIYQLERMGREKVFRKKN